MPLVKVALCLSVSTPGWHNDRRIDKLEIPKKMLHITTTLTIAPCFDSDQPDAFLLDEIIKSSDGITSATNTGHDGIRQLPDLRDELLLDFSPDDALEITHNGREWMRPDGRANEIMSRSEVRNPIAHGLIDRVLECFRTRRYRNDLFSTILSRPARRPPAKKMVDATHCCSEHLHPEYVQLLSPDVF